MIPLTLRAWAENVVTATTLEGKLTPPPAAAADTDVGVVERRLAPVRPTHLMISPARVKVPPVAGMSDAHQRGRILHALANHELQAAELFAWALLAYPEAPSAFRRGLAAIAADEQRHCRLYLERMAALGVRFGDYGVTGHFWKQVEALVTPLDFLCAMGLVFENANLDFALDYVDAARAAGDDATAAALEEVHRDEVRHVGFAWRWLIKLKPAEQTAWEAFTRHVHPPLSPERARGKRFDREGRVAAGLADDFIAELASITAKRPNGQTR